MDVWHHVPIHDSCSYHVDVYERDETLRGRQERAEDWDPETAFFRLWCH